jgi:F0F1-type ATP synthase assembly protein I
MPNLHLWPWGIISLLLIAFGVWLSRNKKSAAEVKKGGSRQP